MTTIRRPESKYFTDRADAKERTLRALAQVGFSVKENTNTIRGITVDTFSHHSSGRATYAPHDRIPDIAAVYTDENGNQVSFGMNLTGQRTGPYDWYAQSVRPDGTVLDEGGNHDTNQPEFVAQMGALLGSAHFDKQASRLPSWTDEYQQWEANLATQLDPMYSDTLSPQA